LLLLGLFSNESAADCIVAARLNRAAVARIGDAGWAETVGPGYSFR